jgi:DNA helicase-2/ATP-dependent DNA helicase PcrA
MRRLDPAQTAAAKGLALIQLTLAGPGSGKTSTLTGRFIHLLRQGVDPARILAVTFTKKAADEMGARIVRLLDLPSAAGIDIMTFHAFAYRLLKRNPAMAGLPDRFPLWDAAQQRHVFTSRRMWWNEEVDILDIIGGAKERMLDADALAAEIDGNDDVLREAVKYFRVYEKALQAAGAIDFADMVPMLVSSMRRNESYRRSITGAYDHVLVDEYQDVNPGQIALLDQFVRDGVGLWAVGDDDQTLYAFRASDVRYILEFVTTHPEAQAHVLDRNYRSSPEIVLAAKRLIRHNKKRVDKDYQPTVTEPGDVVIRGYASPDIEARQVTLAIVELIKGGVAPNEIAVLYRSGAIGLRFQAVLKEAGVPFEVRGGADLWQSVAAKLVTGALIYLRDGETAAAMSRLGSNKRADIVREQLGQVRAVVRHQFGASCQHVQRIVTDAVPGRASEREKAEWSSTVDTVITLAASCASLEDLEQRIAEQSRSLRKPPEHAVVLSTIHSAKGLEWDTVFLVGMEDGVLPHVNAEDHEEERRVAYVGISRAKRRVGLTYSSLRYGDRSRPSPFLFEIAGREKRHCIWTGARQAGADDRLPLLTRQDKHRISRTGDHTIALETHQRAAGRIEKATHPPSQPPKRGRGQRR